MNPYPVFLRIEEIPCIVVGGGAVACRKTLDLLDSGARTTVIAETAAPELAELAEGGRITLIRRRFRPDDLDGMFLVFAATDDREVNAGIARLAREKHLLVNAVDDPENSGFISGAVVKRGPLSIAVSTNGCGPLIAARIRDELGARFDESRGEFITLAGEIRRFIISGDHGESARACAIARLADEDLYEIFLRHGKEMVWSEIRKTLSSS